MEKQMSPGCRLLYKFSSRGLLWPAIFGAAAGMCLFSFSWYINAIIGIVIGYLLIFPLIGIFTPVTYTVLLAAAAFVAHSRGLDTHSMTASILLAIHLIRTISMLVFVRKYPAQTRNMDAEYQRR